MALTVLSKTFPITAGKSYVGQTRPGIGGGGTPGTGGSSTDLSWVPPVGQFANISLNTLVDVRPPNWPSSDVAGPFINWSGAQYAPDFSALGAYVLYGSGHISSGYLWSGVWCFDLSTRMWVGRNIPPQPMAEDSANYNQYGESILSATLGHTATPHTYDGLAYQSTAQGGSSQGSLWTFFYPGDGAKVNTAHRFDLSSLTAPAQRMQNDLQMVGQSFNYPMTATDTARNGIWVLPNNGNSPVKFVKFSDNSVASFDLVGYNEYGGHSMVYLPAPYDCLVAMGPSGSGGSQTSVYVCPLVGNAPQGFVKVSITGTIPSQPPLGCVWSTILQKIVTYEEQGSYTVHKITPPASGSLTAGTWTFSAETLTGVAGATPARPGINTNSGQPYDENGNWGKFMEIPSASCFLWANGVNSPVQAWRLQGM